MRQFWVLPIRHSGKPVMRASEATFAAQSALRVFRSRAAAASYTHQSELLTAHVKLSARWHFRVDVLCRQPLAVR